MAMSQMKDITNHSIVYNLIYEDNTEGLQKQFDTYNIDIDYVPENDNDDHENGNFLCFAVQESKINAIKFLLQRGANIHYIDNVGLSAIHIAVLDENIEVIKLLMNYGADINFRNNEGNTPLLVALQCGEINVAMLIDAGIDIFIKNNENFTALHFAAESGDVQSVKILIKLGLDIHAHDNKILATPLHYAALKCNNNVIDVLLKAGANIEAQDIFGNSPLLLASKQSYTYNDKTIKSVQILIQAGADVHVLNKDNITALQLAISFGLPSIVTALIKAGAHYAKSKKINQLLNTL